MNLRAFVGLVGVGLFAGSGFAADAQMWLGASTLGVAGLLLLVACALWD